MYKLISPELLSQIEDQERDEQSRWLFLEESQEFRGCWEVDSLWPEWFYEFESIVGHYRVVTPIRLAEFLATAKAWDYKPVFVEDPADIVTAFDDLKVDPDVMLQSTLEHTTKGFLPWQVIGYNKLIKDEDLPGGYVVWTTGAGKTAFIASAIKHHTEVGHPFDLALVVVKSHNKIDMQRKLKSLGDIDAIVLDGAIKKRDDKIYPMVEESLQRGEKVVLITNYEKFRNDWEAFRILCKRRNLLVFWDEMPTKLSNPETQLYRAVKKSFYDSFWSKPRPAWQRHWALTATPIENSPGDVWSCVNILWPGLLGSKKAFENTYVAARHFISDEPIAWKNLDHLEAQLGFMTHRVSKEDPEVARMFPAVIAQPTIIDWHAKQRALYDKLTGKAHDLLDVLEDANLLAMIQIMQMVCDAPSMIQTSAQNREKFYELLEQTGEGNPRTKDPKGSDVAWTLLSAIDIGSLTDIGHTKLEMWREIICDKHPNEKIVTHSTWAEYIFPIWTYWLEKWGVSYVIYAGTPKQKQDALDRFRTDPEIRVFLSGDAGADSIDIAEARVGVNYNIPWTWTKLQQREGRRDRVTSEFDTIYTYTLMMSDSIDERKRDVCERKHGYHQALFDGRATEESISATLTREEMVYLLTGVSLD